MVKCSFSQEKDEFFGKTISSHGIAPIEKKIDDISKNLKLPTSEKSLYRPIGFVNVHRQYLPNLAQKLITLYRLLERVVKCVMTNSVRYPIYQNMEKSVKEAMMTLRLSLLEKQLVEMWDASGHTAGYVVPTEY